MTYTIEDSVKVEGGKTYIRKERLQDIVNDVDLDHTDYPTDEYVELDAQELVADVIEDDVTDIDRWSINHRCIFKLNGKFYRTYYSVGATEMQDEAPYEYDGDWIGVVEVEPKKVTVTEFVAKGDQ